VVTTATTPTDMSGSTIHAGSGLLNCATISGQFQLAAEKSWRTAVKLRIFDY
jgi:hypothetical protein